METIKFTYDTKNGKYYAFTNADMKDRPLYQDAGGYFFKKNGKNIYIDNEATERLEKFKKDNV